MDRSSILPETGTARTTPSTRMLDMEELRVSLRRTQPWVEQRTYRNCEPGSRRGQ